MKQRIGILVAIVVAAWMSVAAQTLSVASFNLLPNDLTANMAGTQEKDQNGDVAALIKVVTSQTGFSFEGGAAGIVKIKQEVGEIWVYVPHGIKKITIKHPQLGVLRDYYFPCAIEAAKTYEMALTSGEVRTVVTQDAGGSFLAMSVTPKNASVYVDDVLQANDGTGEYLQVLPYGEHQYRVEAGAYMPEAGVVQIGKDKTVLNVHLKSAKAKLIVKSTTADAVILVNEQEKGKGTWSGEVNAGMYIIECRLDGHQSYKSSVTLKNQDERVVTIPALVPLYGMLEVSFKPLGAEVWMDGKKLGASPDIFKNVLCGKRRVTIKKPGYADYSEDVLVEEGKTSKMVGVLTGGESSSNYSDYKGKVPQAGTKALDYYNQAIMGDAEAQNNLGLAFVKEKNYVDAVYWFRKSAEQGDPVGQYNLGEAYHKGYGVRKNIAEALKLYHKAAAQGEKNAIGSIGYCYITGDGVAQDAKQAVEWFKKAAALGNNQSMHNMGLCYELGEGVSKDLQESAIWYRKAAELGNTASMMNLAQFYMNGQGVKRDKEEAVKWLMKAAEQGNASAQYNLGACYEFGNGVKKNKDEALKWYRMAADKGERHAQERLSKM